jgi:hypothetical protein
MKLTKAQAKEYSLIKWKHAKRTGETASQISDWINNHPKLERIWMSAGCGYCHRYHDNNCRDCPLFKVWETPCWGDTSLFVKWFYCTKKEIRKKYAEQIYQDIKRS